MTTKPTGPSPMPQGTASTSTAGLARSSTHANTIAESNAKLRSKVLRGEMERALTHAELTALHEAMLVASGKPSLLKGEK